jgi:hypothetical protein
MIARLRARHLRLVVAAAALAAVGAAGALAVRRPPPTVAALPEALREAASPAGTHAVWERADLWEQGARGTRLLVGDGAPRIELVPAQGGPRGALAPDVLLYASAGPVPAPADGARLPPDAVLLGAFPGDAPRAYPLPEALADGGWLVLWSLARQQLVDRARLPAAAGAARDAGPGGSPR